MDDNRKGSAHEPIGDLADTSTHQDLDSPERESPNGVPKVAGWILRLVFAFVMLGLGVSIFSWLAMLRTPPSRSDIDRKVTLVDTATARRGPATITLSGFGTVEAHSQVVLSSQVGGRVQSVATNLAEGEIIPQGTILFQIEDADFRLRLDVSRTEIARLQQEIKRLEQDGANLKATLAIRDETLALSRNEVARLDTLAAQADLVTATERDQAKRVVVNDREMVQALQNQLATLPMQADALQAQIARLEAQIAIDQLSLDRCIVRAPFTGRVLQHAVEAGQAVNPGEPLVTLSDDSRLELAVPLVASDVQAFLQFAEARPTLEGGWFPKPTPVAATVKWIDRPDGTPWQGEVSRVESYDRKTRTVKVLVTLPLDLEANRALPPPVAGMFCAVEIPGVTLQDLIALPRTALRNDGNVYAIAAGKLVDVPVQIVYEMGAEMLIRADLQDGQEVIISKLSTPLNGMPVEVRVPAAPTATDDADSAAAPTAAAPSTSVPAPVPAALKDTTP